MAKKQSGKSASKPKDPGVKTSIAFETEAYRTLGAAALWTGDDRSKIVNDLIKLHLSRYAVTCDGRKTVDYVKATAISDRKSEVHEVNLSVAQGL